MVTLIIDPTTHAHIGQGIELDAHLLIATHVCRKQLLPKNPIQILLEDTTIMPPTNTLFNLTFVTTI